jgi:hypothetical protein
MATRKARTVVKAKQKAVEIPDDEDDELGPSYIELRGISSLIEISDDSDDSEIRIGRVTASQAFETADLHDTTAIATTTNHHHAAARTERRLPPRTSHHARSTISIPVN